MNKNVLAQFLCPICQEQLSEDNVIFTPCIHKFHKDCIKQFLETCNGKTQCPECKYDITELLVLFPDVKYDYGNDNYEDYGDSYRDDNNNDDNNDDNNDGNNDGNDGNNDGNDDNNDDNNDGNDDGNDDNNNDDNNDGNMEEKIRSIEKNIGRIFDEKMDKIFEIMDIYLAEQKLKLCSSNIENNQAPPAQEIKEQGIKEQDEKNNYSQDYNFSDINIFNNTDDRTSIILDEIISRLEML